MTEKKLHSAKRIEQAKSKQYEQLQYQTSDFPVIIMADEVIKLGQHETDVAIEESIQKTTDIGKKGPGAGACKYPKQDYYIRGKKISAVLKSSSVQDLEGIEKNNGWATTQLPKNIEVGQYVLVVPSKSANEDAKVLGQQSNARVIRVSKKPFRCEDGGGMIWYTTGGQSVVLGQRVSDIFNEKDVKFDEQGNCHITVNGESFSSDSIVSLKKNVLEKMEPKEGQDTSSQDEVYAAKIEIEVSTLNHGLFQTMLSEFKKMEKSPEITSVKILKEI